MTTDVDWFRTAYASAVESYLLDTSESTLRAAYELGREAVSKELSVLDLAVGHHDVLISVLGQASDTDDVERITTAAGDFFLESLAAFEMVQRGFREAQEAALLERRHAAILRRLSNFLADASLALSTSDSLEEMLRLVAEQAREITDASCCLSSVVLEQGEPETIEVVSHSETDPGCATLLTRTELSPINELIRSTGRPMRMTREEFARDPAYRAFATESPGREAPPGLLAAPLTTLDGRELGWIQLLDKQDGDFTEIDEAALVHLAQMASAAIERARLYER
ncbi:MAG: GAF domain-containing protein [Actinobacteria bacterium]|nr:GAF domain-containing protein [Actinomycetota bacterium]